MNREQIGVHQAKYIQSEDVKFIEGNHLANVLGPEADKELYEYGKKLTRMISKVNPNREKSINPMMDRLEKQIVQPEINTIYSVVQMKELGIQIQRPIAYIDINFPSPLELKTKVDKQEEVPKKKLSILERYDNWINKLKDKGWKI